MNRRKFLQASIGAVGCGVVSGGGATAWNLYTRDEQIAQAVENGQTEKQATQAFDTSLPRRGLFAALFGATGGAVGAPWICSEFNEDIDTPSSPEV